MHGNDGRELDESNLKNATKYVYENRAALNAVFEIKPHINDIGAPHAWLPRKTIFLISKDPLLYTLNRLMKTWGFTRITRKQQTYKPRGKCPFTKRDSTKARFQRFVTGNPAQNILL